MSRAAAQQKASASANASYRSNLQTSLNGAKTRLNSLKSQLSARAVITARPRAFFLYPHARQWEYQASAVAAATPK
jgi:hypothetical protein